MVQIHMAACRGAHRMDAATERKTYPIHPRQSGKLIHLPQGRKSKVGRGVTFIRAGNSYRWIVTHTLAPLHAPLPRATSAAATVAAEPAAARPCAATLASPPCGLACRRTATAPARGLAGGVGEEGPKFFLKKC